MHRATLLPFIIVAAVIIGGLLYLYGGSAFHQSYTNNTQSGQISNPGGGVPVSVLAEGTDASGVDERVNYRIMNVDQLTSLWQMLYTDSGQPVPRVDFDRYEVLAIFDGSHSTGGYGVELTSIKDGGGERTVTITHSQPGDSCVPPGGITSPFIILQVPKSVLPIQRVEKTVARQCP